MRVLKRILIYAMCAITLLSASCGHTSEAETEIIIEGFPQSIYGEVGDKIYFPLPVEDGIEFSVSVNDPDGASVEIIDNGYFYAQQEGIYRVYYTCLNKVSEREWKLPVVISERKGVSAYFSREEGYIKKQHKRDFKILVLPDIQLVDPELPHTKNIMSAVQRARYKDRDRAAFNIVRELIETQQADFIVLLGDNVYGQFDNGSNFRALVDLIDSYETPWAYVNGNHDGETDGEGWGLENQLSYIDTNTDYCMYVKGEIGLADSYGNYVINIMENEQIAYSMYFLDTHGCIKPVGIYPEQVNWYSASVQRINQIADKNIESIMFFHIAIKQFSEAMYKYNNTAGSAAGIVTENQYGDFGINIGSGSALNDNGLWQAITLQGSTKGIFCGHEHRNSASVMHDDGVRLTYALKTGFYDSHQLGMVGGTLVRLAADDYELSVQHIYLS